MKQYLPEDNTHDRQRGGGRAVLWLSFCLVWACSGIAFGQPAEQQALRHVDRQLQRLVDDPDGAGVAVCVASKAQILLQHLSGTRDIDSGPAVNADTRFRVASLSKGFASTVTAQLVAEGRLSWSDRVKDSADYFSLQDPKQAQRTRLEDLLSHRVGLPHNAYDRLLEAGQDPRAIVRKYARVDLICPVGSCYGYQNIAYNVITDVVRARTGASLESQVEQRLFRPLGMTSAGFGREELTRSGNWARPHVGRGKRLRGADVKADYYRLPASAGVNASISDMCHWLQAQLGAHPDVLSDALRAELWLPRVETRREMYRGRWRRLRLDAAHYGLGWRLYDYAGEPTVFHAGSVQGYGAQIVILPERDIGLVALWNSQSTRPWGIAPVFVDAVLGLRAEDWMKLDGMAETEPPIASRP